MVQKKYIKIGVVAISMVALAIGLGVGISQSQNKNNTTAASASTFSTYDNCGDGAVATAEGKSGKSGPTSPSEGKARKLHNDMLRGKSGLMFIFSMLLFVGAGW